MSNNCNCNCNVGIVGISSRRGEVYKRIEEILGSDIKLLLSISVQDIDMDIVDFDIIFKVGNKSLTLTKSNLVKVDKEHYLICIKAPETTIGDLIADIILKIPDRDFEDNICTKVKRADTNITIVP